MEELFCAAVSATAFPSGGIDSDSIPSVVGTVAIAEGWGPLYVYNRSATSIDGRPVKCLNRVG